VHRAENTDLPANLREIFGGLNEIGRSDYPVILPLHPRTGKYLKDYDIDISGNLRLIEPVSYLKMLLLEKNAGMVLTDSGGIQKEAYHFLVPCITLRKETEWVETVECGMNRLSGPNKDGIIKCVNKFSEWPVQQQKQLLYGDGSAAQKAIDIALKFFKERSKC
jgi:UDP-GlcNAc3NAcA epimerase